MKIFIIGVLILIAGLIFILIKNKNIKVEITLSDNLRAEINSEVYIKDYITEIRNGEILNLEHKIDTQKLGKSLVEIKILNTSKKEENYSFEINVVDTESPVIDFKPTLTIKQNEKIDLTKDIIVKDNSGELIDIMVEGEYDLNTVGDYNLYYVATDSSNNQTKEEFKLIVKKNESISETFKTNKGYTVVLKNGVYSIDGTIIVNKTYSLPSTYGNGLTKEFNEAFNKLKNAALNDGITLKIVSGFRSYSNQVSTYNYWVNQKGKENADKISARPGHSEHQLGLAVDINSLNTSFKDTKEGKWLNDNAYKYGFVLRYPEGKSNETGYSFEPWHYRYVGTDLSYKLYNNGAWITIEEYFGITSSYK